MGEFDTDSRMMREQQNKDVAETIDADETHAAGDRHDSDPESAAARQRAKAGDITRINEQMDAVFDQNKRCGSGSAEARMFSDRAANGQSLVHPGRSLLGS